MTALDPRRKEFKIELPHRVFALEADTPEDKGDWVNALNVANKTEAFMIDVLNDSTSFNPKEVCDMTSGENFFPSDPIFIASRPFYFPYLQFYFEIHTNQ